LPIKDVKKIKKIENKGTIKIQSKILSAKKRGNASPLLKKEKICKSIS
jgi:hypothetical protein